MDLSKNSNQKEKGTLIPPFINLDPNFNTNKQDDSIILEKGFRLIEMGDLNNLEKYLNENKKIINHKNKYNTTLLGYASLFVNIEIIDLLLKYGADLSIKVNDKLILEILFKQLKNTTKNSDFFVNYFKEYFSKNKFEEFNNMNCIYDNLSRLIKIKEYEIIKELLSTININKYSYVFSKSEDNIKLNHFPLTILGFINNSIEFIEILRKLNFNIFVKTRTGKDIIDFIQLYKNKNNGSKQINTEKWIVYLNSIK